MKKFRILACSLVAVLVLTGCGNKTLTCTKTESNSGLDMTQEISIKFKGKKVTNMKVSVDSKATTDTIKNNWDMFVGILDAQYPESNEEGVNITTQNNADKHTYKVSIDIDLNKASESALEEYDLDGVADVNSDIKTVKAAAEKSGYTCK